MKKTNNRGFGKVEIMAMLALIAILLAVGSKIVLDSTSKNYNSFKTTANNFANQVSKYKDKYTKDSNIYYLYELIEKEFIEELHNPLSTGEYCDKYNSYVEVPAPNNKKVTLICGNYLIEGTQGQSYNVYELSDWSDTQTKETNDQDALYNYKKNGTLMLEDYQQKNEFLHSFYVNEGKKLSSPFSVNQEQGMELVHKQVYRTKTLVKEIK